MKLAAHLKMSLSEAQEKIDAVEFRQWKELDRIDPLPPWRDDFRIGKLIAELYAIHFPGSAAKPTDFIPEFNYTPPTKEEVSIKAKIAFAALKS